MQHSWTYFLSLQYSSNLFKITGREKNLTIPLFINVMEVTNVDRHEHKEEVYNNNELKDDRGSFNVVFFQAFRIL